MKKNLKPTTISFPTPVYIVSTYNEDGSVDAMDVAEAGYRAAAKGKALRYYGKSSLFQM